MLFPRIPNGSSEGPTRETGVRHDVVLFRCYKGRMAEKFLCSAHVLWIADGPESRGGVAEAVQVDRKPESLAGALPNPVIDRSVSHRSSPVRRPETGMLGGTGDGITEMGQVPVDAGREMRGKEIIHWSLRLRVLGGDFGYPTSAGFQALCPH